MGKPGIFLDRDGVIALSRANPAGSTPPVSVDDVVIPDGAAAALHDLHTAGYLLVVVSNQPDVARGTTTEADVDAINALLRKALPLDAFYICFHDGQDCDCRKPRPGLLLDATRDLNVDLATSWMIGDRWVDIGAGAAAGVRTVLIEREYSWNATSSGAPPEGLVADARVPGVAEAAAFILAAGQ